METGIFIPSKVSCCTLHLNDDGFLQQTAVDAIEATCDFTCLPPLSHLSYLQHYFTSGTTYVIYVIVTEISLGAPWTDCVKQYLVIRLNCLLFIVFFYALIKIHHQEDNNCHL